VGFLKYEGQAQVEVETKGINLAEYLGNFIVG
jgi:hypothetical protein